jgi:Xaa-Pro dipeptidase
MPNNLFNQTPQNPSDHSMPTTDPFAIDVAACRARQQRLIESMTRHNIDLTIVTRIEHVQYLTGYRSPVVFAPAAALWADGYCLLVAPHKAPLVAAADDIRVYEAKRLSTMHSEQRHVSTHLLLDALAARPKAKHVGVEFSSCGPEITTQLDAKFSDIEQELYRLRRSKDADEIALIRKAIAATGKMYERAREIIRPGINELEVFNELQAVAVCEYSEMLTGTGNDYQCASRGGPPRDRICSAGELYILDLGPAFRGYFADNARTIAVDGNPTDAQQRAWQQLTEVFPVVEELAKPGASCAELFFAVKEQLASCEPWLFNHHLGHGIGLEPHEAPHLNPNWDDLFEVGEVFTAEPGLYHDALNHGIRLENDYLITETGVELLSPFPLNL